MSFRPGPLAQYDKDKPRYSEAEVRDIVRMEVEAERNACEAIARKHEQEIGSHLGSEAALTIAAYIALRKML